MNKYDELRQAAEAVIDIGIATNATEWHIIDHFQDLASAEVILTLLDENEALRAALQKIASTAGPTAKWARDIADDALGDAS